MTPAEHQNAGTEKPAIIGSQRSSLRLFISGHSLVDQPLPTYLEQIASSLATPLQWERQYVVGSSIERRTRGLNTIGWEGYRSGYNKQGENLDVVAELANPQRIEGPYDALLITEEHVLLDRLFTSDPVRLLRHYHDRLIAGNPHATTYFYQPWLDVSDKSNPAQWIAYERAASSVWQCMTTRINASLAFEGKPSRIVSLPASTALVGIIERATQADGLPSITQGSVRETVDSFLRDSVHLQPLGTYYVALVSYAAMYQQSPVGAWRPDSITEEQASALQAFAWQFVSDYYANYRPLTLDECRARLLDGQLTRLWSYVSDTFWRQDVNAFHAYVRLQRRAWSARKALKATGPANPFYFDPATDRSYWLPAP